MYLFAGDVKSSILCYDLKAGNEMWRKNLYNIEASPVIINGEILLVQLKEKSLSLIYWTEKNFGAMI
jgi:outer membrane protein assembly factor BamB